MMQTLDDYIEQVNPQLKKTLEESLALGICIVQSPGAWTRMGLTWQHPRFGYITWGFGVQRWGTSKGLAELAWSRDPKPTFHSIGLTVAPLPNLVLPVSTYALDGSALKQVKALVAED